jgi:hypothetical protein
MCISLVSAGRGNPETESKLSVRIPKTSPSGKRRTPTPAPKNQSVVQLPAERFLEEAVAMPECT